MLAKIIYLVLLSSLYPQSSLAEDLDGDEDLEYFFKSRQKSTIEDFPLQEIASEDLSAAAIAGALRVDGATGEEGKPAYLQEKEASDKKKSSEGLEQDERLKLDDKQTLNQSQISAPQLQQPIYQEPTGRTYGGHTTHTILRP